MSNKFNLLVCLLLSVLFCSPSWASLPAGYSVREITPQRYLFENLSQHVSVVVSFDAVTSDESSANSYFKSSRFIQDAKNARHPAAMGFGSSEPFEFQASREQHGSTWMGVLESAFKAGDKSALVSERLYYRNGWAFHVLISTLGNQTASSESQRDIFEAFAPDLGLSQKVASIWNLLITDAIALGEVGATNGRPLNSKNNSGSNVSQEKTLVRCEAQADQLGIDSQVVRHGTPAIYRQLPAGECGEGAKRVWSDIKQSSLDSVHAVGDYSSKIANGYDRHRQYIQKQLNCRDSSSSATASVSKTSAQQESSADWIRQSQIFQSAKAMLAQSGCAIAGHVSAAAMTVWDVDRDELAAVSSGVQSANNTAAALGKAAGTSAVAAAKDVAHHPEKLLYLSPTYDATLLASQVYKFAKSGQNPAEATFAFLSANFPRFSCLNDQEQTRVACKFVAKAALEISVAVATGGATSAALRAVRVSKALDESLLALESGTRAEQKAAAIRFAKAGAGVGARKSAAEKVIGRTLTTSEKKAVTAAHLEGESGAGAYTKTELLRKTRILKEAGFNQVEREKLMRIGITGTPISPAGAAAAATSESFSVPHSQRSVASDILPSSEATHSAAYFEKQAATYSRIYKTDLERLDNPATTASEKAVADLHQKASDVARLTMRSISNDDVAKIEYVGDANGKLTRMMQLASHAGTSTSDDAGQVMAKVIKALPAEKRADFISSLNNEFSAQNRVLAGERPPPATGTYGRNLSTVVNSTYRNTVTEALGLHQPEDAEKIASYFKRLDDASKQKEALSELMATPHMRGVDVQTIKDLRSNAASAIAQHERTVRAEEAIRKAAADKAALEALAKRDAAAAAEQVRRAEEMRAYQGLKPTTVDVGPLGRGR